MRIVRPQRGHMFIEFIIAQISMRPRRGRTTHFRNVAVNMRPRLDN